MLVIRIELWPKGNPARKRDLGIATISNVGGTLETGEYDCKLLKSPEYSKNATREEIDRIQRPRAKEIWRRGRVSDFPRSRLGPWDLVFRALGQLISDRNTGVEFDADVRGDSFGWEKGQGPVVEVLEVE